MRLRNRCGVHRPSASLYRLLADVGAADVSFVASKVPMIIDGVGLSGHDDHTEKETADLRMLAPLTKRAALLIHRVGAPDTRVQP